MPASSAGCDSENQCELPKQVSEYVSCLRTADLIIATNYKTSITVTVVFLGGGEFMGIHRAGLTCQV